MIKTYIIVALVSYLLGSIPFGYILVKLFLKRDIRSTGSGNIGATNVARSGAKGLAVATLLLDALKGCLAVWIGAWVLAWKWVEMYGSFSAAHASLDSGGPYLIQGVAALFAILGHLFPIWLRFRGGKGVATAGGAFFALFPMAMVVSLLIFVLSASATRYVSLGSISSAVAFPFAVYSTRDPGWPMLAVIAFCSFLIILKHHENIRRLIAGTENKFGGKKSVPAPDVMEKQA